MKRLICLALCVATACVGPARTDRVYEGKAVDTAKAVLSAVETARLAASTAPANATGQYLSVALREAEKEADAASGAFDSIQPPSDRSEKLHDDLAPVFRDAVDGLRGLRIAVRRSQLAVLRDLAARLAGVSKILAAFVEERE
jgi:hypothetical protein